MYIVRTCIVLPIILCYLLVKGYVMSYNSVVSHRSTLLHVVVTNKVYSRNNVKCGLSIDYRGVQCLLGGGTVSNVR